MQLCDLPEDILTAIIRWCLFKESGDDRAQEFKLNLPLLTVCRLLRRFAIPAVYRHAFVRYGDGPNTEEHTDVVAKTNLDLIAGAGCAGAVRCMVIDLYNLSNPFPEWRDAIQKVRTVSSKWRVVELQVGMHSDSRHPVGHDVHISAHEDCIAEVSSALVALMPEVRRLKCSGLSHRAIARSMYGQLAAHYADQLQRLDSQQPISVPLDRPFTRLQHAQMDYDGATRYLLPRMTGGELVSMRLIGGPPNHSWAPFSTEDESREIEFAKLERLSVGYYTTYKEKGPIVRHRDGYPWKLHFPSLKSLTIVCPKVICPLLEYAVLPPRMESIYIEAISTTFHHLADLVLPATKKLFLGISLPSAGSAGVLPVINRLLNSAHGSETLSLMIRDYGLPAVPESFTCTALTHLLLCGPTSVDAIVAFIEKLPRIVELVFDSLDPRHMQMDISIPEADDGAIVEPLSTSLSVLAINYARGQYSPDTALAVAKYMLLRIPSLTKLAMTCTSESQVREFVDAYAPRYPHLSATELIIREGEESQYKTASKFTTL